MQLEPTDTDIPDQTAQAVEVVEVALKPARALTIWRAGSRPGTNHHTAAPADLDMVTTDLDDAGHGILQLALYNHDATTYENHIDRRLALSQ